jgi:NAD(P)-dependent dehydrogenase (short-subunit alcohol dehydrogenase family)
MHQEIKKVAIITGGSSGIGLAIAEKFISEGIHTVVVGRNADRLSAVAADLGSLCYPVTCDLNNLPGIPLLIEQVMEQFGQIDILVNNAGINMKKDFISVTDEEFQQVMTTNVSSVFAISREVVRHMLVRRNGSIINISSMAAQYGLPRVIAYSASKAAIDGMTRAMAVELSPHGIRINAIAPGFIETAMTAVALDADPERKAKALDRTPMGYLGKPVDIAEAAAFLASDAARYITGVVMPVDGGNSVGF